ncbi:PREDICTED: DNA ligase 1 [Tinamus guttatus]|uniref:DNA ligase 1 n=1 Tax=Tinamus guttatus TaxID=94827 RepID=UPI00052ED129|nr:PREDICTED: DNA ligase 1 [Tinamus guttatus]
MPRGALTLRTAYTSQHAPVPPTFPGVPRAAPPSVTSGRVAGVPLSVPPGPVVSRYQHCPTWQVLLLPPVWVVSQTRYWSWYFPVMTQSWYCPGWSFFAAARSPEPGPVPPPALEQGEDPAEEPPGRGDRDGQDAASPCPRVPGAASPGGSSAGSTSSAEESPDGSSVPRVPRRRTAQKQVTKRKGELANANGNVPEPDPKRLREEPGDQCESDSTEEEKDPSSEEAKEGKDSSGDRDVQTSEMPKPSKAVADFFAPRKGSRTKTEAKAALKAAAPKNSAPVGTEGTNGAASSPSQATEPLDPAQYNPSKSSYHPVHDACWAPGQRVPYLAVARTFERIEEVSARLKNIETLSNFLRSVIALSPSDLLACVYLCLNRLGPAYEGLELGIGESILMKAVAQATGRQLEKIKSEAQEKGDLGSLQGKLRIGLAEQSVLVALAHAASLTPPGQGSSEPRGAPQVSGSLTAGLLFPSSELPNYGTIIPVLLEHGLESLPLHCKITPGIPLKPMLAQPTKGVGELLKRFEEAAFTCEYKYDGERAQIHILEDGAVYVYSRNQENNTSKYPDIVTRIPKVQKASVRSCILDAEAVAWDPEKKQIQPFQVLMTRKRKDVEAAEIKVQVCLYAFDMLYLNGESLVKEPFSKRRRLLRESFVETEGEFLFATSMDACSTEEISEFLDQSIKDSCEGLMVKTLDVDATYEIAKRSHKWLKLKKDYLEGVGDTLDLVVIGAYLGKGKRVGMYGGFLLACYDEESEEYQSICKIGTGFTEESLEKHHSFLKDHVLPQPRPYYRWDSGAAPDHWLAAVQVWEVKCGDLSISPIYKAAVGLVDEDKGISLRFPRFLRVREDKKPEEATSSSQVAELYKKQQQIQNQQLPEKGEDEDFY